MPLIVAALALLALSFEVRRYAWPAYYLVMPLLGPVVRFLVPTGLRSKLYFAFVLSLVCVCLVFYFKWPFKQFAYANWDTYCRSDNVGCSPASAEFLRKHHLTSHLLSLYGWGGWLIWNYPDIKPTIDGRMHLWEEHGYSGFVDYYRYEQDEEDVDKSKYDVVYMPSFKPVYERMKELVKEGKWKLVYQDPKAGIFVRR